MNKLIITLSILIISKTLVFGQIFDESRKFTIRDSSLILLNKYQEYADLTEDGISISRKYISRFLSLFTENANLVNDLYGKKQFITPNEFVKTVKEKYNGGIEVKIELDSAYFKNLTVITDSLYSVQIDCKKYTVGLNNQNKIIRKDIEATFTVTFNYQNDTFGNFKIKEIISKKIILKRYSDKKIKGLYLGVNANILSGKLLFDNNIQYYNHDYKLSGALSAGITANYYLSSNYAVSAGIEYCNFNSNFNTTYNNEQNNNLLRTDIDNDKYYLYVNSDFSEENNLKYISLPVKFIYRHKLYNETSFFASLGISISYILSSESYISGNSVHSGWYDEYNLLVDNAPLYDFGSYSYNNTFDLKLADIFLSGNIEAGISFPLKKSIYLNTGLNFNSSFTDLKYNESSYKDDYIYLNGIPKSLFIQSAGIFISCIYKI
ncbi:MAG: PorT family protein [Chlorobi bacterium]|nr:PorT family protein [Chlorobiota bacterium]